MSTRTVSFTVRRADGTAWADARLKFTLTPGSFDDVASYPYSVVTADANSSGVGSVVLWTNEAGEEASTYVVTFPNGETDSFTLPEGGSGIDLTVLRLAGVVEGDAQYSTLITWLLAQWKGDWAIGTAYGKGDKVYHDGSAWIAEADTTAGQEPGVHASWGLLALGLSAEDLEDLEDAAVATAQSAIDAAATAASAATSAASSANSAASSANSAASTANSAATAANAAAAAAGSFDAHVAVVGKPGVSEVLGRYVATRAFSLPASLTGSRLSAGTAAAAQAVFSIRKNGVEFGTATVAISGTTATFASASGASLAIGDVLTVIAPSSQDATLADVAIGLAGTGA